MLTAIFTNLANWRPRRRFTRHDLLDVIFVCVCIIVLMIWIFVTLFILMTHT